MAHEKITYKEKKKWTYVDVIQQIFLVIVFIIWLYPIYKMLIESLKGGGIGNYHRILFEYDSFTVAKGFRCDIADFWVNLKNSLVVTAIDMALILLVVTLAAYAFAKMDFPGKNVLYIMTILGMMMPAAGFIVPYFIVSKNIGLLNTVFCLVGPHVSAAIPMSMIIIRNNMDAVNDEMIEAAIIDGCGKGRVFTKMMLPLCKPAIATASIFAFMGSWNDYLLPLVMLNKAENMTLTLLPQKFMAYGGGSNMHVIFACLVMISLPIFLLYCFAQKYMISGMTAGTIK